MEVVVAGVSWAFQNVSPQKVLSYLGLTSLVAAPLWTDLSSNLSPQASIVLAGDPKFNNLTSRWREWQGPEAAAVVIVFNDEDVQETIRYANDHDYPFFALSGGHGATLSLGMVKNAVMIDMRALDEVRIADDGKSATIGGGARIKQTVQTLWDAGKQTVTGICECVGIAAPALGGGHGWLQGKHGLATDQILSAKVVLPSGDLVTASASENSDLFWALKGAGHNFGIVTSMEYQIYDVENQLWSIAIFIFDGGKLEYLFELTNKMMSGQPPHMTNWMYFVNIPEIDPKHPVIWCAFISDGPLAEIREYTKPINALGPLIADFNEVPYPDLAALTYMGENTPGCAKGLTGLRFPVGLDSYNPVAIRNVYDAIDETTRAIPQLSATMFLLEMYSTHGVRALDEKSTAFPHRRDQLLLTSYVMYQPNATMDPIAQSFGKSLRRHLLEGSDDPEHLRAYVNYAHGDEAVEEIYGWEDWRLEKLRALKAKWDPENRMRFYNPII